MKRCFQVCLAFEDLEASLVETQLPTNIDGEHAPNTHNTVRLEIRCVIWRF